MEVWKVELGSAQGCMMPRGAKPLSVHMQNGVPCMWLLVDPSADREERSFHTAGTGHKLPDNISAFIGTFLVENDALVFHVFELT